MTRSTILILAIFSILALVVLVSTQIVLSADKKEPGKGIVPQVTEAAGSEAHASDQHSSHVHDKKGAWVAPTEDEYKQRLSSLEYKVLRQQGTERAFTGAFWDDHSPGVFHCRACGLPLFDSKTKYDSGTGWPSFWTALDGSVDHRRDFLLGMVRTELICARCASHLGHVFPDGPAPTGKRYCINSASLELLPEKAPLPASTAGDKK